MSMIGTYGPRPVEIQAVRLTLDNIERVWKWIRQEKGRADLNSSLSLDPGFADAYLELRTKHGIARANLGDWVLRGVSGEFSVQVDEAFTAAYISAKPS